MIRGGGSGPFQMFLHGARLGSPRSGRRLGDGFVVLDVGAGVHRCAEPVDEVLAALARAVRGRRGVLGQQPGDEAIE